MGTFMVVEQHCLSQRFPDLRYVRENHVLEKLVLQRVVDSLGFGIVLGIATLGHADHHSVCEQSGDVVGTFIVHATVDVMYGL